MDGEMSRQLAGSRKQEAGSRKQEAGSRKFIGLQINKIESFVQVAPFAPSSLRHDLLDLNAVCSASPDAYQRIAARSNHSP
jgi:hypothetical protein